MSLQEVNDQLLESYMYFDGKQKDFWDMTISEVLIYIKVRERRRKDDNELFGLMIEQAIINQVSKRTKRLNIFDEHKEVQENAFKNKEEKHRELNNLKSIFNK